MSLNGADPSGQAGGGPWDSIRHRRMKDVLALQNGISYIYISYLQILYFYIIIIISLLDLILRHWGWWITVFPRSSTILLRCAFAGKASMVIFDPLLCIIEMLVSRMSFSWLHFDDLMTSYHHHNLKTWSAPGWSFLGHGSEYRKYVFEFCIRHWCCPHMWILSKTTSRSRLQICQEV